MPDDPGDSRTTAESRMARLLAAAESAGGRGLGWLWLLLGWILARNLLEGVLERPRTLGFDWREDLSTAMVFLHFPLFYLLLFAGVVLVLHAASRRPLGAVARATSLAFGLLLAAPVLDAIASGGRGYDLKYLLGFGSVLWRFWDPRASLDEVSPGQRAEIVLACLLGGIYVWLACTRARPGDALVEPAAAARAGADRTAMERAGADRTPAPRRGRARPAALAIASAAGIYLLAAFAGAWPSLFARWSQPHAPSASAAYDLLFQGPGLIAGESRRHAVVMALPLLALLPVLAWRADPRRFRALLARLSWTRLVYYAGLVPAGAWIGAVLYSPYVTQAAIGGSAATGASAGTGAAVGTGAAAALAFSLFRPGDLAALAVLTAAMVLAVLAAVCWNDLADREADRISEPGRPLVCGLIEAQAASRLGAAFAAGSLFFALCVSHVAFLLVAACLLLAAAYSLPPLRLKRAPFLATGTLAALSLLSLTTGFSLFAQEAAPAAFPRRLALALLLGVTLGFQAKDLKDAEGDARTGVRTLATMLRPPADRVAVAILVALSYLLVPLILPVGTAGIVAAAAFALAGVGLIWRRRRPDVALLAAFCIYAVVLLALLASHPDALRDRRTDTLLEAHAAVLRAESEARAASDDEMRAASTAPVAQSWFQEQADAASPLAESLRKVLTARAAGVCPPSFEERLWWAVARSRGSQAWPAAMKLARDRPLQPRYHQALFEAAIGAGQPREAANAATIALQRGLRPRWFLRQRAAATLAAVEGAAPGISQLPAEAHERLGQETERDLRGALLFGGPRAPLFVLAGDLRGRDDRWVAAERCYDEAARCDPAEADAWAGLGRARYARGEFDAAVAAFLRAAALDPVDPWIRNNLGVALRDAGRAAGAREQFMEARRLAPRMFEPVYNLGLLAERDGRLEEARDLLREAREIRPGFRPIEEAWKRVEGDPADR